MNISLRWSNGGETYHFEHQPHPGTAGSFTPDLIYPAEHRSEPAPRREARCPESHGPRVGAEKPFLRRNDGHTRPQQPLSASP